MADCVYAGCTANLKAALEAITSPTYNTNVQKVEQARRLLKLDVDEFMLLQEFSPEYQDDFEHTSDEVWKYRAIYFRLANDDGSNNPFTYQNRNVVADVRKAIMVDRTRGGNCDNTIVRDSGHAIFVDEEGNMLPGTYVDIDCMASVDADDPYNLAQ